MLQQMGQEAQQGASPQCWSPVTTRGRCAQRLTDLKPDGILMMESGSCLLLRDSAVGPCPRGGRGLGQPGGLWQGTGGGVQLA